MRGYGYSVALVEQNRAADDANLGVRLGRLCMSKGIPVFAVAARLKVSRPTIYNWFRGCYEPAPEHHDAINALLDEHA